MMFTLSICGPEGEAPGPSSSGASPVHVWRDGDGTACAYGYSHEGQKCIDLPDVACFKFDGRRRTVHAYPRKEIRRRVLDDAYYRLVLPLVLQDSGYEVLHASGVCDSCGVLAFTAPSGTGKSTMAHAFAQHGLKLWADDAVVLSVRGKDVCAHALPFRLRLNSHAADALGRPHSENLWFPERAPEPTATRLSAIFVLDRIDGDGVVDMERLRGSRAFEALLTNAYCYSLESLDRNREMMRNYARIASQVPVFHTRFGSGFDRVPDVVNAILRLSGATL